MKIIILKIMKILNWENLNENYDGDMNIINNVNNN